MTEPAEVVGTQIEPLVDALSRNERPEWPALLEREGPFAWLGVCLGAWDAIRRGRPLEIASVMTEMADVIGAAGADLAELVQTAERLARTELPNVQGLFAFALVLLSTYQGETPEQTRAARQAAAALGSRALEEAAPGSGAAIAVRLARVREELGDVAGAERAWTEAVRRDPLLTWALASDVEAVKGLPEIEAKVIAETFGEERLLREAVRALRAGDRAGGTSLLDDLVGRQPPRSDALFLRAVEHVRDAAQAPPRSAQATRGLTSAEGLLGRLPGTNPAIGLLEAMIQVIGLDRNGAVRVLRDQLARLAGVDVEDAEALAIVSALTELVRRPPFDPQRILQAAYFDAILDPLLAAEVPRGPFASFRKLVIGLSLVSMMSSAGSAFAMVNRVEPPPDVAQPPAATVVYEMTADAEGSDFDSVLIPPVTTPDLQVAFGAGGEGGEGGGEGPAALELAAVERGDEVRYVHGAHLADRRQIPEGYWLSEMIGPQDVPRMQEDGVRVVLSAVRPSAETLEALDAAGIEQVTVRMGARFRHADTIRDVASGYQPNEILIHCTHGADRTGTIAAFLLVEQQGWDVADAFYAVVYPREAHVEGLAYALSEMGIDDARSLDDPSVSVYAPHGREGSGGLKAHNEDFRQIIYTAIQAMDMG